MRSRNVVFDENSVISNVSQKTETLTEETEFPAIDFRKLQLQDDEKIIEIDTPDITESNSEEVFQEDLENADNSGEETSNQRQLRDRNCLKPPERYGFEALLMSAESEIEKLDEPKNYIEAINGKNKEHWNQAINSLNENKTWTLENLPAGKKAISTKWVFKVKMNPDGTIERFKARLVVQGFYQKKGIDYGQTFSPVARASTVGTLLSVAASNNMYMMQFDVSTAFLYGYLEEEIYIKQPE